MFSKTRNKLTLFFAGIMIFFLIAFNGTSYFILSSLLYSEREKEIQLLADIQAQEHAGDLLKNVVKEKKRSSKDQERNKDADNKAIADHEDEADHEDKEDHPERTVKNGTVLRPFYYIIDRTGNWVGGNQPLPLDKRLIMNDLKAWVPKQDEVKYLDYRVGVKDEIHLLFAGRAVYNNGAYWGSVYTGADISQQTEVIKELMLILLILSGLFFAVSVVLGYFMSGRAMVPIIRSFNRQRQFVADASHELRTPLSVVQSSLEVIEAEEEERMGSFSRQVLDDMKDEVKRMTALVAHMLTLARADSDEVQLKLEAFQLNEELEKLLRKLQPLAAIKDQNLTLEAEKDLRIRADRERIRQLLTILVDNAIQYTPEKGSIHMAAAYKGEQLEISVADSGIGIPREKLKDVFERFYRVDTSRSRSGGNAGLGLSIAKWIVESHGGKLHVDSQEGKGSTFTVILPSDGGAKQVKHK